ncbi:MAG: hypothetical protein M1816_005583 [Peltula sp. TS41687]|nr:MAG: hypothetical protein M1816_005583 [Peltula sp. TS41687]
MTAEKIKNTDTVQAVRRKLELEGDEWNFTWKHLNNVAATVCKSVYGEGTLRKDADPLRGAQSLREYYENPTKPDENMSQEAWEKAKTVLVQENAAPWLIRSALKRNRDQQRKGDRTQSTPTPPAPHSTTDDACRLMWDPTRDL